LQSLFIRPFFKKKKNNKPETKQKHALHTFTLVYNQKKKKKKEAYRHSKRGRETRGGMGLAILIQN